MPDLSTALEGEPAGGNGKTFLPAGHGGDALAVAHGVGQFLVEELFHLRLVVEEVDAGPGPRSCAGR